MCVGVGRRDRSGKSGSAERSAEDKKGGEV